MDNHLLFEKVAIVAGTALPLFNIPLIIKLVKRKSAKDFSLFWVLGVWVCSLLMLPQALVSDDLAFKLFGIVNISFFTVVTLLVLKYSKN